MKGRRTLRPSQRVKNLTGRRFGRLVVRSYRGLSADKSALWECRCDCGNVKTVMGKHLRRGAIQSCGCFRKERVTETFFKDLGGKKFGRLVALRVSRNDGGCYIWKC